MTAIWAHINAWKAFSCAVLATATLLSPGMPALASPAACVFLGAWGAYCALWLTKSALYPDKSWDEKAGWPELVVIWGALNFYLPGPALMLWRGAGASVPAPALGALVASYGLGTFWHYGADAHKHAHLALSPGSLCTSGLFSLSRNPNYFGELLTYACLTGIPALALRSFWPLAPLACSFVLEWVPRMKLKDASLRRHGKAWEAWAAVTPFCLPSKLVVWRTVEAAGETRGGK